MHEVQPLTTYIAGERVGPRPITVSGDTNSLMKVAEKILEKEYCVACSAKKRMLKINRRYQAGQGLTYESK